MVAAGIILSETIEIMKRSHQIIDKVPGRILSKSVQDKIILIEGIKLLPNNVQCYDLSMFH